MTAQRKEKKATKRGFLGRGGGAWLYMRAPVFMRGTADQIAGLFPWLFGTGTPMVGVPLGRVLTESGKGGVLCCDPISWFERAKLISTPSAFILGLPSLGKSTLIRRWILGLDHMGVKSLVLGDLKGEHVPLVAALGGQVIPVGRGRGYINVLDMGDAIAAVYALRAAGHKSAADQLLAEAKGRRQSALEMLLTIHRSAAPTSRESAILANALRELDEQTDLVRTPVLKDLLSVVQNPTEKMHSAALSRGEMGKYQATTENLESDLVSLAAGDGIGEIFSQHTSVKMKRGQHVVFDVSGIGDEDRKLQAAALMLCWSIGFAQVAVGNALADAGLERQQRLHVVLDELWRVLRAGPGLVDRADSLTRLGRDKGVAVTFASHTMDDLASLPTAEDRKKAQGMVERCGMVLAFGLPASEMPRLRKAVKVTPMEAEVLQKWSTLPTLSRKGRRVAPPGRGMVLLKVGSRKGIRFHVDLTTLEEEYSKTSKRWEAA